MRPLAPRLAAVALLTGCAPAIDLPLSWEGSADFLGAPVPARLDLTPFTEAELSSGTAYAYLGAPPSSSQYRATLVLSPEGVDVDPSPEDGPALTTLTGQLAWCEPGNCSEAPEEYVLLGGDGTACLAVQGTGVMYGWEGTVNRSAAEPALVLDLHINQAGCDTATVIDLVPSGSDGPTQ